MVVSELFHPRRRLVDSQPARDVASRGLAASLACGPARSNCVGASRTSQGDLNDSISAAKEACNPSTLNQSSSRR